MGNTIVRPEGSADLLYYVNARNIPRARIRESCTEIHTVLLYYTLHISKSSQEKFLLNSFFYLSNKTNYTLLSRSPYVKDNGDKFNFSSIEKTHQILCNAFYSFMYLAWFSSRYSHLKMSNMPPSWI